MGLKEKPPTLGGSIITSITNKLNLNSRYIF